MAVGANSPKCCNYDAAGVWRFLMAYGGCDVVKSVASLFATRKPCGLVSIINGSRAAEASRGLAKSRFIDMDDIWVRGDGRVVTWR